MGKPTAKHATVTEMEAFQQLLLQSVREMKAGEVARVTQVPVSEAASARASLGMSQADFAELMGVSVRTLQDWEQGRRRPSRAARTLLRVAQRTPEAVRAVV